ncbi:hypothetical protein KLP28_03110 [Nocardioidaceae bacterium]|nr:hypothetical protein KLP28_03110 [Nocardioidaceae bacterium]
MSDDYESDKKWYYCTKHGTVEPRKGCKAIHRLGPYDTREEAARALEIAEKRNEAWDDDPDWNDDVAPSGDDPGD